MKDYSWVYAQSAYVNSEQAFRMEDFNPEDPNRWINLIAQTAPIFVFSTRMGGWMLHNPKKSFIICSIPGMYLGFKWFSNQDFSWMTGKSFKGVNDKLGEIKGKLSLFLIDLVGQLNDIDHELDDANQQVNDVFDCSAQAIQNMSSTASRSMLIFGLNVNLGLAGFRNRLQEEKEKNAKHFKESEIVVNSLQESVQRQSVLVQEIKETVSQFSDSDRISAYMLQTILKNTKNQTEKYQKAFKDEYDKVQQQLEDINREQFDQKGIVQENNNIIADNNEKLKRSLETLVHLNSLLNDSEKKIEDIKKIFNQ